MLFKKRFSNQDLGKAIMYLGSARLLLYPRSTLVGMITIKDEIAIFAM